MFKKLFGKSGKEEDANRDKGNGGKDDNIVVLKKTEPNVCGGTDATLDKSAPKEIKSTEMTLFSVTSALGGVACLGGNETYDIGYISAFAAEDGDGFFLFLEKGEGFSVKQFREYELAYVKNDIFPELVAIVNEHSIAKNNGFHSTTHGLPENFGGLIEIRYKSGERISISDNQTPVITPRAASDIAKVFEKAMQGEKIEMPSLSNLKEIRFEELRNDGGYTRANLVLNPDGTGANKRATKYEEPKVYESENVLDAETVKKIIGTIDKKGMLAWANLPEFGLDFMGNKKLTFVFDGGREIEINDGKIVAGTIQGGFFEIEMEMVIKCI